MGKVMWAMAIVFSVCATLATPVSAQKTAVDQAASTEYAFDDDLVQGDLLRPDVEVLQARRRGARDSLITVREHFLDRLLSSVEDL